MKAIQKLAGALAAAVLVLSFAACGGSGSKSSGESADRSVARTQPLTLRLGCLGSGREDDCQSYPIGKFKEIVESRSNGMIKVDVFPDGQLGGEPDMMDQVLTGYLDVGCLSANVLATVWPQLYVYNLPFAFSNLTEFWQVCGSENPEFLNAVTAAVDGSGKAKFISSFSAEFRGCQNTKRPIRKPADFRGLTFRVMAGEIFTDIFRALGASTATVPFGELYTALQQGVVDGEDIGFSMFYDNKLYEVEKYATQFNITPTVNALIFSNSAWNKLSDAERAIIYEAAAEAEKRSFDVVNNVLSVKYFEPMAEKGVTVIKNSDLTADEINACREAVRPVWTKFEPVIGSAVYSAFSSSVDRVRSAAK
ncbi:TRAP transporter substrate-binding protein [Breznakiella homolactica]|uniref:TRAP transporter substrate-binding protein n=1 Tax=Breznakiella homolactica TaxID=2798577 RepID=A0A7T7XQS1_9SPIR|nr:TRAP transporter substrate-binding protein [Breznakiella homolactica]QQO10767.1 TRAP transporter substrate-binding protein [Breznakiella homolactica]